jgi:hypothetical protein
VTPADLTAAQKRVAAALDEWALANPGNDQIAFHLHLQGRDEALLNSLISAALGQRPIRLDDPAAAGGLTFIAALAYRRPMRRGSSRPNLTMPWLFLGSEPSGRAVWRRIETGELFGLHAHDYEAADWEVMP